MTIHRHTGLQPALIALVVGLHFIPFAWAFKERMFYTLGGTLALLGGVGLIIGTSTGALGAAVASGLAMSLILLAYSLGLFATPRKESHQRHDGSHRALIPGVSTGHEPPTSSRTPADHRYPEMVLLPRCYFGPNDILIFSVTQSLRCGPRSLSSDAVIQCALEGELVREFPVHRPVTELVRRRLHAKRVPRPHHLVLACS